MDVRVFCMERREHRREEMGAAELCQPDGNVSRFSPNAVIHLLMECFIECDDGTRCLKVESADSSWGKTLGAAVKQRCTDVPLQCGKHL